jgi:hypothetical protein
VAGVRRAPWLLAAGIAGHGLLWDAWHFNRGGFVPDWYVLACLVVDLTFGFYVATQAAEYAREARGAKVGRSA